MAESQYTLRQFTNLNKGVNQLDFLVYLENEGLLTLNKQKLKENKDRLLDFIDSLIKNWKEHQEYEFNEIRQAEIER